MQLDKWQVVLVVQFVSFVSFENVLHMHDVGIHAIPIYNVYINVIIVSLTTYYCLRFMTRRVPARFPQNIMILITRLPRCYCSDL